MTVELVVCETCRRPEDPPEAVRPGAELVASVHVYVEDVDRVYARALDQGATSLSEPRDQPYGDRTAGVQDVQGNYWWIGTRLRGEAGNGR